MAKGDVTISLHVDMKPFVKSYLACQKKMRDLEKRLSKAVETQLKLKAKSNG